MQSILAAAIAVALLLIAASAMFASRVALVTHRSLIELVHLLGAADSLILRPFVIRSLWQGLMGGAIGAVAALLTVVALGSAGGLVQLAAPMEAIGLADWRLWAILIGVALVTGLLAMAGATATVLRRLALMF